MSDYQWQRDQAIGEAAQREWEEQHRDLEKLSRMLRNSLRKMVDAIEYEANAGDGVHEDYWDDYHAARMMVGRADKGWDCEAARRGLEKL